MNRRPWAAALIALFFSPVVGMLYLGRGCCAAAYFLAFLLIFLLPAVAANLGLLLLPAAIVINLLGLVLVIAGTVHCYRLAKRRGGQRPAEWFARWYSLLGFFLAPLVLAILLHNLL